MHRNDEDIFLVREDQAHIYYCARVSEDATSFASIDDIIFYLRGMPVEEGDMYHILVNDYGDKMPQNYYGRPYIKDESGIVLSRFAEPTVGRDKIVRNDAFKTIEREVETLRAEALRCFLKESY